MVAQYGVMDSILELTSYSKDFDFVSNRSWTQNSNLLWILRCFSLMPGHKLALIGDGEQREVVLEMAAKNPNVYVMGRLDYDQNLEIVSRSKFFLSLTSSDGASLSLMEAMALGCVPIVSNIDPNREWVEDGVNGFLVDLESGDEGLLNVMKKAVTLDLSTYQGMVRRSRDIIRGKGLFSSNMRRIVSFIGEVF